MSELNKRILTATMLAALAVFLIFNSFISLLILVLMLIVAGLVEFLKLTKTHLVNKILSSVLVALAGIVMIFGALAEYETLVIVIFFIIGLWWLNNLWTVIHYPNNKANGFPTFFNAPLLFVPLLFLVFIAPTNILLLFLIVWGADSCAYFAGKVFGKHKLVPNLSGGKTIEGVIGGLLGALAAALVWMFVTNHLEMFVANHLGWKLLPVALITAAFSIVGDLYISVYKREAGVKNSGNILPGHGGVLDRIDGLLAATPIFILCLVYL